MHDLDIWKNQQISRLKRDMDRLFDSIWDEFGLSLPSRTGRTAPSIDLIRTKDNLIVRVELPGVKPEDIDISIKDDNLRIKGEIRQESIENGSDYQKIERRYGSFSRTIKLPCRVEIDDVKANFDNGILEIKMPRCTPEEKRTVKIEW